MALPLHNMFLGMTLGVWCPLGIAPLMLHLHQAPSVRSETPSVCGPLRSRGQSTGLTSGGEGLAAKAVPQFQSLLSNVRFARVNLRSLTPRRT